MPYQIIPLLSSIILGFHHALLSGAPRPSRWIVGIAVGVSLLIWLRYPQFLLAATLLQVAASIYVLLWLKLNRD